jgi:hypothetical protein
VKTMARKTIHVQIKHPSLNVSITPKDVFNNECYLDEKILKKRFTCRSSNPKVATVGKMFMTGNTLNWEIEGKTQGRTIITVYDKEEKKRVTRTVDVVTKTEGWITNYDEVIEGFGRVH